MLKELIGQYGDSSISVLRVIRRLSDDDFEGLIAVSLAGDAKAAKKTKAKTSGSKKKLPKDSPVTRIAAELSRRGLSGRNAQEWLALELVRDGVQSGQIPQPKSDDVEEWLAELVRCVSSAIVFDVARNAA